MLQTNWRQRVLNIGHKTLAYEINAVIKNAADDGRSHLNDDEANHLLKISEKLVLEYLRELEGSS